MDIVQDLAGFEVVFDHTAVAATRIRDLLPIYRDLLGGTFIGGGDTVTAGYRTAQFGYPGGGKIELMEPLAGSGFFDSFFELTRGRGGVHHLNFHVNDIDAAVRALRAGGYRLHGLNLENPEWREVFLHPKEAHGTLIQLAQAGGDHGGRLSHTLDDLLAGGGHRGTGVASP